MAAVLWREKTPAVVVADLSELSLVRISDYAKIHHIDPRTVIAAIAEDRLVPPAFPLPYEGLSLNMKETENRWLISLGAVIKPRTIDAPKAAKE